jgi:cytochrome c peroxidase
MTPLRAFAGATILGMVAVFFHAAVAQPGSSQAYFPYPPGVLPADLEQEIQRVQGEVDQIFQQALAQWRALPINPSTRMPHVQLLGKLLLFDKNLSVNRNQACSFCHMPYTAFTGPISSLNGLNLAKP